MMMMMMLYVQCGWYWGQLSFDEAEARLCDLDDGSFLVRDSSDDRYILSLSFRSQSTTHHTRIEHYKGTTAVLSAAVIHCHSATPLCHSLAVYQYQKSQLKFAKYAYYSVSYVYVNQQVCPKYFGKRAASLPK